MSAWPNSNQSDTLAKRNKSVARMRYCWNIDDRSPWGRLFESDRISLYREQFAADVTRLTIARVFIAYWPTFSKWFCNVFNIELKFVWSVLVIICKLSSTIFWVCKLWPYVFYDPWRNGIHIKSRKRIVFFNIFKYKVEFTWRFWNKALPINLILLK